jgi:hypothetical protein
LFRWRETTIDERAKKVARMVEFICYELQTKTYDQFVSSFSNPGNEPDASERDAYAVFADMLV